MDFFQVVAARASVRAFKKCEVSIEDLETIVDAGRKAPSGRNRQPWQFIIVRDSSTITKLGRIQKCIEGASAAIAVVMDEKASEYWKEDAAAAIENMLLATVALGYASLWVEGYVLLNEAYGKEVLAIPGALRLIALLPIGKPAGRVAQAQKRPLTEITHYERFGGARKG